MGVHWQTRARRRHVSQAGCVRASVLSSRCLHGTLLCLVKQQRAATVDIACAGSHAPYALTGTRMHRRTRQRRCLKVHEGLLRGCDLRRRDGEQGQGVALDLLALARLRCIPGEWGQCAVNAEGLGWGVQNEPKADIPPS